MSSSQEKHSFYTLMRVSVWLLLWYIRSRRFFKQINISMKRTWPSQGWLFKRFYIKIKSKDIALFLSLSLPISSSLSSIFNMADQDPACVCPHCRQSCTRRYYQCHACDQRIHRSCLDRRITVDNEYDFMCIRCMLALFMARIEILRHQHQHQQQQQHQ